MNYSLTVVEHNRFELQRTFSETLLTSGFSWLASELNESFGGRCKLTGHKYNNFYCKFSVVI